MIIELNYGEYKFTDFVEKVQNSIPTSMYSEDWVALMLQITNRAKATNITENLTFADDRLILAAYKIMLVSPIKNVSVVEWAVLKRYFEMFYKEDGQKETQGYINLYIGLNFFDGERTEKREEEMASYMNKIIDSRIDMPSFFYEGVKGTIEPEKPIEEEDDVLKEWLNLKEICEISLQDKSTTKKDRIMYENLLKTVYLFTEQWEQKTKNRLILQTTTKWIIVVVVELISKKI